MNFEEFLMAHGEATGLELLRAGRETGEIPEVLHRKMWDKLKEYYITGGMPQIVKAYLEGRDSPVENLENIRKLQKQLVNSYSMDFAKHSGKINSMHIVAVFENIPLQLSQNIDGSVKRYYFKGVLPKKKGYSSLEGPIQWLEKAGLLLKSKICNRAEIPLESFTKSNIFKLFMFDTGLLGAMLDLPAQSIESEDYGITKGFLAENFVAQEFKASGVEKLYSWEENTSEIEFLRIMDGKIVPVEVKSGTRTKAKSLRQYIQRYNPDMAIKVSGRNLKFHEESVIKNYPLYMAGML
jgi:predicted AAA+ superfamily ATPase